MAGNVTSLISDQNPIRVAQGSRPGVIGSYGQSGSGIRVEDKDKVTLSSEAQKITAEYKSDKQTIENTYNRKKQTLQAQYSSELQQLEAEYRQNKFVAEVA